MALTEAQIKYLKPRGKRYAVSDGRVWPRSYEHRLCLVALPLPTEGQDGKSVTWTLPADEPERCEVEMGRIRGSCFPWRIASTPEAAREVRDGERLFNEVILRDRKNPIQLRRYLEKEIYPAFAGIPLRDVIAQDVQRLVFRKRDNGFPAAAADIRNLIKRIFDYAVVCGLVTINPAHATPMRFTRARTRTLSASEITSYLRVLYRSNIRRQFKLALNIILLTLVRKSELLQASWRNVNFDTGEWLIESADSKTGKPHAVYMSRQVCDLFRELQELAGDSALVLPGRGSLTKPFAENALNKALEGLSFPMEPFTIHDLRRTGSTLLHEQGFPSDVVEKALNHSIGGVCGVYNRAEYSDQCKHVLQSWADYIDSLKEKLT